MPDTRADIFDRNHNDSEKQGSGWDEGEGIFKKVDTALRSQKNLHDAKMIRHMRYETKICGGVNKERSFALRRDANNIFLISSYPSYIRNPYLFRML